MYYPEVFIHKPSTLDVLPFSRLPIAENPMMYPTHFQDISKVEYSVADPSLLLFNDLGVILSPTSHPILKPSAKCWCFKIDSKHRCQKLSEARDNLLSFFDS